MTLYSVPKVKITLGFMLSLLKLNTFMMLVALSFPAGGLRIKPTMTT